MNERMNHDVYADHQPLTAVHIITTCSIIQSPLNSASVSVSALSLLCLCSVLSPSLLCLCLLATHPLQPRAIAFCPINRNTTPPLVSSQVGSCSSPLSSLCAETVSNLTMPLVVPLMSWVRYPWFVAPRLLGLSWFSVSRARFCPLRRCLALFLLLRRYSLSCCHS